MVVEGERRRASSFSAINVVSKLLRRLRGSLCRFRLIPQDSTFRVSVERAGEEDRTGVVISIFSVRVNFCKKSAVCGEAIGEMLSVVNWKSATQVTRDNQPSWVPRGTARVSATGWSEQMQVEAALALVLKLA